MTFEIYVFIRFISKMNNKFHRKDFHRLFFFNVKESLAHLAEKNSKPGAKIITVLRLS